MIQIGMVMPKLPSARSRTAGAQDGPTHILRDAHQAARATAIEDNKQIHHFLARNLGVPKVSTIINIEKAIRVKYCLISTHLQRVVF